MRHRIDTRRIDTRRMRHGRILGQKNGAGNRTGDVSTKVIMGDGQIETGFSIMDGVEIHPRLDWACADMFGVETSNGKFEKFNSDSEPLWEVDEDQIRAIRKKWACRSNAAPILDAAEIVRCHMRKW